MERAVSIEVIGQRAKHPEPMDAEPGRFAILRDPLGGMIGVIKPASA